jgi:hypothetical protein
MAKNKRCNSKSFRIDNQIYFVVGKYLETQGSTVSTEIKKTLYKIYNNMDKEEKESFIEKYKEDEKKYFTKKSDVS